MSTNWKFRRRQGACSGCAAAFAEGEPVWSLLRVESGELARGDLCGRCFDSRQRDADLFWWRTSHRAGRAGALRVDFDLLLAALARLARDERAAARDLAFLMALLLVRHRRLRLLGVTRRDGAEFLRLRRPRAEEVFEVEARELDAGQRARLTAALAGFLDPAAEANLEQALAASTSEGGAAQGPASGPGWMASAGDGADQERG